MGKKRLRCEAVKDAEGMRVVGKRRDNWRNSWTQLQQTFPGSRICTWMHLLLCIGVSFGVLSRAIFYIIPKIKWGNSFAGDDHANLIYDRSDALDKKIWFQLKLSEGDSMVIDLLLCGYSHPSQRCFFSNLQTDLFVCNQRNSSNSWNKTNAVGIMCNTSDDSYSC